MEYPYNEIRLRFEEAKRDIRFSQIKTLALLFFATALVLFFIIFAVPEIRGPFITLPSFFIVTSWCSWAYILVRARLIFRFFGHRDDPMDILRELVYFQRRIEFGLFLVDCLSICSVVSIIILVSYVNYIGF